MIEPMTMSRAEQALIDFRKRALRAIVCSIVDHDLKFVGCRNAGCELERDCCCSVPVHECTRCGACDYGENEEARETMRTCAEIGHRSRYEHE